MATYQRTTGVSGVWAKGKDLLNAKKAKIISETNPIPSRFQNEDGTTKMQDVCKIRFEGVQGEFNISLNRATINALVEAFGEDSKSWIDKVLSVNVLEGSKGFSIYLIPEGFTRTRDDNNYVVIVKDKEEIPTILVEDEQAFPQGEDEELRIEDVPF